MKLKLHDIWIWNENFKIIEQTNSIECCMRVWMCVWVGGCVYVWENNKRKWYIIVAINIQN